MVGSAVTQLGNGLSDDPNKKFSFQAILLLGGVVGGAVGGYVGGKVFGPGAASNALALGEIGKSYARSIIGGAAGGGTAGALGGMWNGAEAAIRGNKSFGEELGGTVPESNGGQSGTQAHQDTVKRLVMQAEGEFADRSQYKIHEGTSIFKKTGLDVHPDVWVEHIPSGRVVKVYEAARTKGSGAFKDREVQKEAKYTGLNPPIPAHLEPVR